jgi:hypothetical protein
MDRRDFLTHTAAASLLSLPSKANESEQLSQTRSGDYQLALTQAEKRVPGALALQTMDRQHRQAGGFVIPAYGFAYPASTAAEILSLGTVYCNQDSQYFHSEEIAQRISLGLAFLTREQNADGTIDLPTTNFHSPPDTAFVVEDLTLLYRLLLRDSAQKEPLARLENFIRRAASAIATGGIHTPNHRWVATSALAAAYQLFTEASYLRRIEAWLAEGIDCNTDGEYTELSNAVYNRVTDRALLTTAVALERPEFLAPVRRNLAMMLYCVHPDGEIVTDYSRRQDRNTKARMNGYYIPYRMLSVKDNNGQFASMADWIAAQAQTFPTELSLAGDLAELMLNPVLQTEKVERKPLPNDYAKVFIESGAARIRRKALSATITSNSARFFSLRSGKAVLEGVRVAAAFFGKGQFISPSLQPKQDSYRLEQHLEGSYYQPLSQGEGIPNPNWNALDRNKRKKSNECTLDTMVTLQEVGDGFEITLTSSGTDKVPFVIEFWFRAGGVLSAAKDGELIAINGTTFLASGFARYQIGADILLIGPGKAEHRWANLRGADPPIPNTIPLTIAGFTPFQHVVKIIAN